jgi:agmatine deiminase
MGKPTRYFTLFPHNGRDWPGKYEAIQWAFIEFIKKVATYETVFLVVFDDKLKEKVSECYKWQM